MTSLDGVLASLIFCLIVLSFALLLWRTRAGLPARELFFLALAARSAMPVVLIAACFLLAEASPLTDSLRGHIKTLYADAGDPDGLRAGGGANPSQPNSPASDPDLLINTQDRGEAPGGYFDVMRAAPRSDGAAAHEVVLSTRASTASITLTRYEEETSRSWLSAAPSHWVGAVPVTAETDLCFADCGQAASHYRLVDGVLRPSGKKPVVKPVELPVRFGLSGWLRPWSPSSAVYLMRDFLPHGAALGLRSILFEDGRKWFVLPLDAGAQIGLSGGCIVHGNPLRQARLMLPGDLSPQTGECDSPSQAGGMSGPTVGAINVHIGLIALRAGKDNPQEAGGSKRSLQTIINGGTAHAPGLAPWREQRSFSLARVKSGAREMLRLKLDKPEELELGSYSWPRQRLLLYGGEGEDESDVIHLRWLRGGERPNSVLSALATHFPAALTDWRSGGHDPDSARLKACNGDKADLCVGDANHAAAIDMDRLTIPWLLLAIAAFSGWVIHIISWRWWVADRVDGLAVAALQFLLAMRAVIAFEGALIDAALRPSTLYVESAVDLVALPTILVALRPLRALRPLETTSLLLFNLVVYGIVRLHFSDFGLIPAIFAGSAIAALLGRIVLGIGPVWAGLAKMWGALSRWIVNRPTQASGGRLGAAFARLRVPTWALISLIALRGFLPMIGFREHIGPVGISALYVPLLVLALGAWMAMAEGDEARRNPRVGLAYLALVGAGLGVTFLSFDVGFILVFFVPLLGLGLWRGIAWMGGGAPLRKVWPFVIALPMVGGLYVAGLLLAPVVLRPPPLDTEHPEDNSIHAIAERLAYANTYESGNMMRLIAVAAPQYVAEIGTKSASLQMEQTIQLGQRSNLFGRGYGLPSNLPTRLLGQQLGILHEVHLTDNVSAVHLMGPFGRLGAVAFLSVLIAASAGMCAAMPEGGWRRPMAMAGALAIWSVFGAAVYMILGNLLLVPFTGRNIYLIAAGSGSDLLEGIFLIIIAVVGLRRQECQ